MGEHMTTEAYAKGLTKLGNTLNQTGERHYSWTCPVCQKAGIGLSEKCGCGKRREERFPTE